jgi:hypothetical protein
MNTIYPVYNQEQIRRAIEHERKIELCSEQVRFNDLVRWRRLETFINDEVIPKLTYFQKYWIKFDPAIHYLWPIPQAEIDSNPALTEADQNYGY